MQNLKQALIIQIMTSRKKRFPCHTLLDTVTFSYFSCSQGTWELKRTSRYESGGKVGLGKWSCGPGHAVSSVSSISLYFSSSTNLSQLHAASCAGAVHVPWLSSMTFQDIILMDPSRCQHLFLCLYNNFLTDFFLLIF